MFGFGDENAGVCLEGFVWDADTSLCVPQGGSTSVSLCPAGQTWDYSTGFCVSAGTVTGDPFATPSSSGGGAPAPAPAYRPPSGGGGVPAKKPSTAPVKKSTTVSPIWWVAGIGAAVVAVAFLAKKKGLFKKNRRRHSKRSHRRHGRR